MSSFNLEQGRRSVGDQRRAEAMVELGIAGHPQLKLPGHRAGSSNALGHRDAVDPGRTRCGVSILGVLYESTSTRSRSCRSCRRPVSARRDLMMLSSTSSLIALIGIVLLIGSSKKNGLMMVDFAISAERDQHMEPVGGVRQAALLRFRPYDDDDGRAAGGVFFFWALMLGTGTDRKFAAVGYAMVGG